MALRENCIYCGSTLTLTAEPRVGPAPRFVYRCAERCGGEALRAGFVVMSPGEAICVYQYFPEVARWWAMRACP
jgi:hypothetical protein